MIVSRLTLVGLVLAWACSTWPPTLMAAALPAFPGAEGFGAATPGGRGGKVLLVTTLEDYDPARQSPVRGSLREACCSSGPRVIVFRVSGTIALQAALVIREPFLTIAGQTAPGGGVCLKNHETTIQTHDVVVRHMRFRTGDEIAARMHAAGGRFAPDALCIAEGSRNVIIDHCSVGWSIDECLSISGAGITDVTVQWCIISESLNHSFHHKGNHGYGSLLRCNGQVTFHHNLYAHHNSRTPRPGTYGEGSILLDFRNNLVYNSIRGGYSSSDPARLNYVANCVLHGPSSNWNVAFSVGGDQTRVYEQGNLMLGFGPRQGKPPRLVSGAEDTHIARQPFQVAPVVTEPAEQARDRILASSGATLPARDAVDTRIVHDVHAGSGRIIDSQKEVGGWPELASAPPAIDRDADGMPDGWELRHELNPRNSSDAWLDPDGDGYPNLEEFLNTTDPHAGQRACPHTRPAG